jgi:hypothetical protein
MCVKSVVDTDELRRGGDFMGYGEFGGGGSVHWRVRHGDGSPGKAGRDGKPNKSGSFQVWVNGVLVATTDVEYGRVVVVWEDDLAEPIAQSEAKRNRKIKEVDPSERS